MKKHNFAIKSLLTRLCLFACIFFILQGCGRGPEPGSKSTIKEMTYAIHSQTQVNLIQAARKMNQTIEDRINKIKIGADKDTFISFVLSDTFPAKFKDGQLVGFVDVSGYGDILPDGQYGVKIFFDKENLRKPSEFINVKTGKQYFFHTDTKIIEEPYGKNASEFRIQKGCTWLTVQWESLCGDKFDRDVCLGRDCPDCRD